MCGDSDKDAVTSAKVKVKLGYIIVRSTIQYNIRLIRLDRTQAMQ